MATCFCLRGDCIEESFAMSCRQRRSATWRTSSIIRVRGLAGGQGGLRKKFASICNDLQVLKPKTSLPHLFPHASVYGQNRCDILMRQAPNLVQIFLQSSKLRCPLLDLICQEVDRRFLLMKRLRLSVTTRVDAPSLMISISPLAMSR